MIKEVEHFSEFLFQWFDIRNNSAKSHILFSGNEVVSLVSVNIDNNAITSESKNDLLGLVLDSNLSFEDHINSLCEKECQKLSALARIVPYICLEKRKTFMKAFVTPQFGYCPLVWMFHNRDLNPLSANLTKWSNSLKQYFGCC